MLPFFLLTQSAILEKVVRAAIVCQRGGGAIPFIGSVLAFKQEKRRKKKKKEYMGQITSLISLSLLFTLT